MRLNKYLSRCGIDSRRKCDELIILGKVVINGNVCKNFSYQVLDEDVVVCNGAPVVSIPPQEVYVLNKLKGYISTSSDPQGRRKVIDLIDTTLRLFTIGRLDRDTTGAILLTNDGDLANKLMHPKNEIEKVYTATSHIEIEKTLLKSLVGGIKLEDNTIAKGKIKRLGRKGGRIYWEIILKEGKYHEVKRIFKAFGSKVITLHRDSFAGIHVNHLKPGRSRKLSNIEVKELIKHIKK
mgnify:CR=1 FL=1